MQSARATSLLECPFCNEHVHPSRIHNHVRQHYAFDGIEDEDSDIVLEEEANLLDQVQFVSPEEPGSKGGSSNVSLSASGGTTGSNNNSSAFLRSSMSASSAVAAQEAPVCRPSAHQWSQPLLYIQSLMPLGRKCGILRIVPPAGDWPADPQRMPAALNYTKKYPTKIQNIHQLKHRDSRAEAFYNSLELFLEGKGSELDMPPYLDGYEVDCFQLLKLIRQMYGRNPFDRNVDWLDVWTRYCQLPCAFGAKVWSGVSPPIQASKLQFIFMQYLSDYEVALREAPFEKIWKGVTEEDIKNFGYPTGKPKNLKAYRQWCEQFRTRMGIDADCSIEELERIYWTIVERGDQRVQVEYANDIPVEQCGSGFSDDPDDPITTHPWNLNNLPQMPTSLFHHADDWDVAGVVSPMMYFGCLFTSFAWHVEDNYLYSINYNHHGVPKVWYGVGSDHASELEEVMRQTLPHLFAKHPDLLHQLVTMVSPADLKRSMVPVYRTVQRAGEFVVTFPRAYHGGFNTGFNICEAVNFAVPDWIPYGVQALQNYRQLKRTSAFSHEELIMAACRSFPLKLMAKPLLHELYRLAKKEDDLRFKVHEMGILYFQTALEFEVVSQCSICLADCFFSCIMCGCSSDTRVCLEDAEKLPCKGTCEGRYLYKRVTMHTLKELMLKLEARLEIPLLCHYSSVSSDGINSLDEQQQRLEGTEAPQKKRRLVVSSPARLLTAAPLPLLKKAGRQGGLKGLLGPV